MARIVYLAFPRGRITGGQKMILRHVETLRELGFDAVLRLNPNGQLPVGLEQHAAVEVAGPLSPDDVLVAPEDASVALKQLAGMRQRAVMFCQGHFKLAFTALDALDSFPADRFPAVLAVGPSVREAVLRLYPQARVEIVRCFADERLFRPGEVRTWRAAATPAKRRDEMKLIRGLFPRLHPRHADLRFMFIEGRPEKEVAEAFAGSALHMALPRLEGVGMTTLEALASGCVCAGFTGLGGRDFATPDNGFWVAEDDCYGAADALAAAADLVRTGGPALARYREAARQTAAEWSYAVFRRELEAAWMALAPEARRREGPLA